MKDKIALFEADELLALATLDIEQGNIESALLKLKQVLAGKKPPADASAMAARLYAQLGLYERAKGLFETYLKSNPDSIVESFQLGMAHFDTGNTSEALSIWGNVVEKDPVNPPALFYRGLALAQQNEHSDAKKSLDKLLQSAPADNLYFSRAKDLLSAIEAGQIAKNNGNGQSLVNSLVKDAYQVEH